MAKQNPYAPPATAPSASASVGSRRRRARVPLVSKILLFLAGVNVAFVLVGGGMMYPPRQRWLGPAVTAAGAVSATACFLAAFYVSRRAKSRRDGGM